MFTFPTSRGAEPAKAEPAPQPAPVIAPEPEPQAEAEELSLDDAMVAADDTDQGAEEGGDELLLDAGDMLPEADEEQAPETRGGSRTWLAEQPAEPAPRPARSGGTLFERMSNIARGAAKAQVEDEDAGRPATRDPLDIPRFLNRQNNQ